MNRPLILTGVALSVVVTLTGCAGKKKAATVAESARPTKGGTAPPAAASTAPGIVRAGVFCETTGAVGKTSSGAWARCQRRPGDTRPRWYVQAPAGKGARAGQFCSKPGSTATSQSGVKLVCTKRTGENRARWHTK